MKYMDASGTSCSEYVVSTEVALESLPQRGQIEDQTDKVTTRENMMRALNPVYLDNAATSWPKPPEVCAAVVHYMEHIGANPGRSGHALSVEAGRIVESARESVAMLFNAANPQRVVFGSNCTEALNIGLFGLLQSGDHVITSSVEHNSIMRPLRQMETEGVKVTVLPCRRDGTLDPHQIEAAIRPDTKLIALGYASNVIGTLLPVAEAGRIARRRGLLLLVDAAATAGTLPIDMQADFIDLLAFPGHKSMLGPTGTGGLVIGDRVDVSRMRPLKQGGTGSASSFEQQPETMPDKFESGTLNAMGLAGLDAGVRWILSQGVDAIRAHQMEVTQPLIDGLLGIPGVTVYGTLDATRQVGAVSINIAGLSPSDAGRIFDEEFNIQCRAGLQCAPGAHQTIGTYTEGTIRFAPGVFTSGDDIAWALQAVRQVAARPN